MYQDYLDAILKFYHVKKGGNDLSSRLRNPTPAKIKNECLAVYQSRFMKKDLIILTTFLEVQGDADILKLIKRGRDRFKPLDNFLRAGTEKPEDRHIELLGWLLDFEPRPFVVGHDYKKDKMVIPSKGSQAEDKGVVNVTAGDEGSPQLKLEESRPVFRFKGVGQNIFEWLKRRRLELRVGGIAVLGVITAIYFNNKQSAFGTVIPDKRGCMIWTGNKYERVSCDSPGIVGMVVPLDESRLQNLHRITMPETLTEQHIRKIWYRKRGRDSIDFYTLGGTDPVDPNMDLKRLSPYMFNEHVRKKKSADSSLVR